MRRLILIAAALGLGACGKSGQQDVNQAAGENLSAESIVSNDVTAIDAVTGDAANMAADVDVNYGNLDQGGGNAPASAAPRPVRESAKSPAPAKANPESNAAANSVVAPTNAE